MDKGPQDDGATEHAHNAHGSNGFTRDERRILRERMVRDEHRAHVWRFLGDVGTTLWRFLVGVGVVLSLAKAAIEFPDILAKVVVPAQREDVGSGRPYGGITRDPPTRGH